jgi:predicted HD superfamily hydrolase involved in NAD metabolism
VISEDPLFEKLSAMARTTLSGRRYRHSLRVTEKAFELGSRYGIDPLLSTRAAIVHDIGRESDPSHMIKAAGKAGRPLSEEEKRRPMLLHGWYGAFLLRKTFSGLSEEVLEAVAVHTAGHPEMGAVAKVVFCADYLEPERSYLNKAFLRLLEGKTLDQLCMTVLEHHLQFLKASGKRIVKESLLLYDTLRRGDCET